MQNRNANSLPGGRAGVEPKTAGEILKRTPQVGGNRDEVIHTPSGVIISRRKSKSLTNPTPFKLSALNSSGMISWQVEETPGSTLTDGTNGALIDLSSAGFDTPVTITSTKYIVLEANVSSSRVLSGWTFSAVDIADANEVAFTTVAPIIQNKIRLYIGKVTISGGSTTVYQAVLSPGMIVSSFLNGTLGKVINAPRTVPA